MKLSQFYKEYRELMNKLRKDEGIQNDDNATFPMPQDIIDDIEEKLLEVETILGQHSLLNFLSHMANRENIDDCD